MAEVTIRREEVGAWEEIPIIPIWLCLFDLWLYLPIIFLPDKRQSSSLAISTE